MNRQRTYSTRRKTLLRNASTLGYGKYKASCGDYVWWPVPLDNGNTIPQMARVMGQLVTNDNQGTDCRGYLVVATIGEDSRFGYERWVKPDEVTRCLAAEHIYQFWRAMMASTTADLESAMRQNSGILSATDKDTFWPHGTEYEETA